MHAIESNQQTNIIYFFLLSPQKLYYMFQIYQEGTTLNLRIWVNYKLLTEIIVIFQMRSRVPKYIGDQTDIDQEQFRSQLRDCVQESNNIAKMPMKKSIKIHGSLKIKQNDYRHIELPIITPLPSSIESSNIDFVGNESAQTFHKRSNSNVGINRLQNAKKTLIKKRKKHVELKDVILNQKVNGLKQLFCSKIKRNNPYSTPVDYQYEATDVKGFIYRKGIELKASCQKVLSLIYIYNIVSSIFLSTLSMAFPEVKDNLIIKVLEILGLIIFLIEIIINFVTIKFNLGRKLQTLKEIGQDYLRQKFPIDIINLVIILIHIITWEPTLSYLRLFVFLKVQDCLEKVQKMQVFIIENYYNEQYWSLVKVFLFNFCYAHILAILLIGMSRIKPDQNWLIANSIDQAPWFQKYVWSYYWGTTIMLTIGFGDFTPVCYQEAICMIFIQTISCMVLAYNINCVGSLISQIRSQDITKSKNLKIFKKLADKNQISQKLSWKINSYFQEQTNIKKLFNIEEEVHFVQKLPTTYKTEYLKQANKKIFQNLFFFRYLMEKTLFSFAQKIVLKITHPEQAILTFENNSDVFILKTGEIGYISRKGNKKLNKYIFDRWKVEENGSPFLLTANFITKKRPNYGIKSINYSVLYCMQYKHLIETLQETHLDYQLYCGMRDKSRNKVDQFQVFPCNFCTGQKHTKFSCPKIHFIPIEQHVINKYIYKERRDKDQRTKNIQRQQLPKQSALIMFSYYSDIYDQKIRQHQAETNGKKYVKQKYIIQQLKALGNDDHTNPDVKDNKNESTLTLSSLDLMNKFQASFLQNTSEVIKMQLARAFDSQQCQDQIWTLGLDRMKNYKDYFAENNPCNLVNIFEVGKRIEKSLRKQNIVIESDQEVSYKQPARSLKNARTLEKIRKKINHK